MKNCVVNYLLFSLIYQGERAETFRLELEVLVAILSHKVQCWTAELYTRYTMYQQRHRKNIKHSFYLAPKGPQTIILEGLQKEKQKSVKKNFKNTQGMDTKKNPKALKPQGRILKHQQNVQQLRTRKGRGP